MSIVEGMDETNKTLYGRIKTLYETRVQDERNRYENDLFSYFSTTPDYPYVRNPCKWFFG